LLIMAMSSMVYAQKLDFRASGFIYTQTFLYKNAPDLDYGASPIFTGPNAAGIKSNYRPGGGQFDRTNAWMSSRARLKFDAVMGKELSGTIQFEMDSTRWGDTSGDRNKVGYWTADRAALEVKHVYIDFAVPVIPVPITTRVGLQPAGVRPDMVLDTDGMGIIAGIKIDPIMIIPQWFKPWEGKDAAADDIDYYSLEVNAKLGKMKVGAYGLYANMNSYLVPDSATSYGDRSSYMADMYWVGVYGEGKLGPVDLKLDFVIDRGDVERKNVAGVRDAKYRGWATRISLNVPIDKFVIGAAFRYGSGADMKKTSGTGLPGTSVAYPGFGVTRKVGSYVIPPGEGGKPDESIVLFMGSSRTTAEPKFTTDDRASMNRGYQGGYWLAKLSFTYKVAPWYSLTLAGMYLGDTTKNGNTIGTARKSGSTTIPRDDGDIGIEIGLWNDFLVYKNLDFNVGLGYIFAGDALEYWDSSRLRNREPDNPWAFNTRLRYRF